MRGYLWQCLEAEILDEFSQLSGASLIDEDRQLVGAWDDRRIRAEERAAAEIRLGPEWARRLVVDAKRRAGAASKDAQRARMTPSQIIIAQRREERKQRRKQRKTA